MRGNWLEEERERPKKAWQDKVNDLIDAGHAENQKKKSTYEKLYECK